MTQDTQVGRAPRNLARWSTVAIFAVAMAWVESSAVLYLRTMVDRIDPYQANPLPIAEGLDQAELVREAATLVMLLMVGILAGRTWRERLGYSAIAFGIWDIFYYVFLKILCGWPHSLLDWDVLFLLPLPWWGPVLAPVSIASLMIVWGTLATFWTELQVPAPTQWPAWSASWLGMAGALYVFTADAARVASQGADAVRRVQPTSFNWPIFCASLVLMAAPVVQMVLRHSQRHRLVERAEMRDSQHGLKES